MLLRRRRGFELGSLVRKEGLCSYKLNLVFKVGLLDKSEARKIEFGFKEGRKVISQVGLEQCSLFQRLQDTSL